MPPFSIHRDGEGKVLQVSVLRLGLGRRPEVWPIDLLYDGRLWRRSGPQEYQNQETGDKLKIVD